jgi:hypothetical protein
MTVPNACRVQFAVASLCPNVRSLCNYKACDSTNDVCVCVFSPQRWLVT